MSNREYDHEVNELDEVAVIEEKQKRVLARLLDEQSNREGRYLAVRGYMGSIEVGSGHRTTSVPSYSSMHTLRWVAKNIAMGSEMDFMDHCIDKETNRLIIDEESAEELKQRAPDWSRQAELAIYLIQEKYRKFGTILAVVSPSWINDPHHENWGKDGRAIKSAIDYITLDSSGDIGLLNLSETSVYALDGQHRVMGIRGVDEIHHGALKVRNKAGSELKLIPKQELLAKIGSSTGTVEKILEEKINIEFIPAVIIGESREEASRRIRSVFVAINSYAKKTDKGENILLNENDGYSIVARRIGHHSIFKTNEGQSRVNWKNASIGKSEATCITTLNALRSSVENYLETSASLSYKWKSMFKGVVPIRPRDAEIEEVEKIIFGILDAMKNLPVFGRIARGDELAALREFPSEKFPDAEGHLLLRPIGFPILFSAISKARSSLDLNVIIEKLRKFDKSGGFSCHPPSSVWFGVTYDPSKQKMNASDGAQNLAADILAYLLAGGDSKSRDSLCERIVDARSISKSEWIDSQGTARAKTSVNYELPAPIQL